MNLLEINGTNYTQHIKVPSYKVNKVAKTLEWEDANYKKHKEITRYKVEGSFTLLFDDISDLDSFFDTVETLMAGSPSGAIPMTLYLNDRHTTETVTAFISFTSANERPLIWRGDFSTIDVTVEEQ